MAARGAANARVAAMEEATGFGRVGLKVGLLALSTAVQPSGPAVLAVLPIVWSKRLGGGVSELERRTEQALPLEASQSVALEPRGQSGWFETDVCFASLGWVGIQSRGATATVTPRNVKGSIWGRRPQCMYPTNLAELIERDDEGVGAYRLYEGEEDAPSRKRRLADAAREGRHLANRDRDRKKDTVAIGRVDDDWWN